jgi:hypothetical protein
MAENPEEVLPEERVAAARRIEERPLKRALDLEQETARDERREREEHHRRCDEHVPGIQRNHVDSHARRPALEHADDQFHGRGNRGHFDERESKQPDVRSDVGLVCRGEGRIHEPAAARRGIEEDRAAQEQAAEDEAPEPVGRQPRKGQVSRAQHFRKDQDREGLEDRHGEQEHHHRTVQREDLVVEFRGEKAVVRERELNAHQQGQHAPEDEKRECRGRVPQAHVLVVHRGPIPPALRGFPRLQQPLSLSALHVLRGWRGGFRIGSH